MIDPGYPALSRVIGDSILWRAGVRAVAMLSAAWQGSATGRVALALVRFGRSASIPAVAAIALAVWLVLQRGVPPYVRPGLPWIWTAAAIVVLAIVAFNARAFALAWPDSTVARLFAGRMRDR